MAEIDIAPNFGAELKDGFKPVNTWVSNGIAWIDDIQQFYRERSAIEKEYSTKLNALAKKYFEKKAKKQSTLSVGETPTVTPGSLESASMTTWTVQLTTLESRAAEHDRFSSQLINGLAQPLQNLQNRYEDLRKSHADYAAKLEKERDSSYAELRKTKGKYDSVCQEVENRRKKTESSFDYGKAKAQSAFAQQQSEMRNMKNAYLIAINVTNKQKERYYHEYVPDLLDSLQILSETRTTTLNNMWSRAASYEKDCLSNSTQLVDHLAGEIPRNNPVLDSMMFVRHNAAQWHDPPDFGFEPSPVWLDDDSMASDPNSKTYLMNILTQSKSSLPPLRREVEQNRKNVDGADRVLNDIRSGKDTKRDEVDVVRSKFYHTEALHEAERKMITAEVEVTTITQNVGDVSVGARNHKFENKTYKIPTNCDQCGDRLWGLSAKGLSCSDCGFTCHTKCQMKVPADCPGELDKEAKKNIKAERQAAAAASAPAVTSNGDGGGSGQSAVAAPSLQRSDTMGSMNTLSSGYATSAHRSMSGATVRSPDESSKPSAAPPRQHRMVAPPPAQYANGSSGGGGGGDEQRANMTYGYQANGEGEITVSEGQEVVVVEPDDGSGWMKVRPVSGGAAGLVPASYATISQTTTSPFASSADPEPQTRQSTASASTTSLVGSVSSGTQKKVGPAVAPRRGGAKKAKHVEALYTYSASGEGEVSMEEGEKMVLVLADQGDGWCEVEARAGKGVVPAGWVKEV